MAIDRSLVAGVVARRSRHGGGPSLPVVAAVGVVDLVAPRQQRHVLRFTARPATDEIRLLPRRARQEMRPCTSDVVAVADMHRDEGKSLLG